MFSDLQNPPAQYRPAPFWSLNDRLDPEELRSQIRAMHGAGLGGFFLHARFGLLTGYLSPEWLACIEACIDEADKLGMNAWLYDENGWPSGFGGGLVNGLGPARQQKILRFEPVTGSDARKENTIGYYTADGTFLGRKFPTGRREAVRFYYELNPYYVDNLDPESSREFITSTHEHYFRNLPEHLRQKVRGIFTDEPELTRSCIPWSPVLEQAYRDAYSLELLEELPLLFDGGRSSAPARIRFWKLVSELFEKNFLQPIFDWCGEHRWMLTGHLLQEEDCQTQISCNGSIMPHYRFFQLPGMDHILRRPPRPTAMTQVFSAASQYRRRQIITESFALCGWNFNFSGMCWLYQQQMAHGINLLCQHLVAYSLRGQRKRDCPGSWFTHQPWWNDFRRISDYFGRVGMLLAEGRIDVRVLVLHPLSSAWGLYAGCDDNAKIVPYSEALERLTTELDALQIAHHYADERIVEACGGTEGRIFHIGECRYDIIVVPQITNFSHTMLEHLRKLDRAGARLFAIRNTLEPEYLTVDGAPADRETRNWFESLEHYDGERPAAEAVAAEMPERVRITEHGIALSSISSTHRDFTEGEFGRSGRFYLFVNREAGQSCRADISLPRTGSRVELIDRTTGERKLLRGVRSDRETLAFHYRFSAGEALLLWVSDEEDAAEAEPTLPADALDLPLLKRLPDQFVIEAHTENLLTLDFCHCRVDGESWGRLDLRTLQNRLLALKRECDLEMEFAFDAAADFDRARPLTLLVERPDRCSFTLNGEAFANTDAGFLFDKAFRRLALPPRVKSGRNTIGVRTHFRQAPEIYAAIERARCFETECNKLSFDFEVESIYLAGDFSVRHTGKIDPLDRGALRLCGAFALAGPLAGKVISCNDLTAEGFPFFAGKCRLSQTFELTEEEAASASFLRLRMRGFNSCKVRVNGNEAGFLYAPPFALPVKGLCRAGRNMLDVEATTSLRNLLGPHHLAEGESYAVGMFSFDRETNVIGIEPPPWDERYCCVSNGISNLELTADRA